MTIFTDPSKATKLEQIEDRALPASVPIVTPGVVAASVGIAVFAASGSIVTVGCAVLPVLTYGVQTIRKWMRSKRFEREHGCIAHLIATDRDMIAYIKIVGEKTVATQLRLAMEEGQSLSSPAKKAAAALLDPSELPYADVATYLKSTGPIDAEVVEKPKTLSAQDEKPKTATTGDAAVQKVSKDVVDAFVDDLRCTILCAPPRTGKGIVAAGMMMGFKMAYPAGKLFSSTIKQYQPEDWYFSESDAHINPDPKDPIGLARELYALYTAWEGSESSAEAPSLFVFDELRDTLLALKGVLCEDVSPDIQSMTPKFDDWLRYQLISAATLNQCHRRYLLLISPTSTAQGMTFKDANSLQSYSSFTLVTPSELAFSEGSNGTFAAPAIRPDSLQFDGWYGLAWHSKTKQWYGVPSVPQDVIALRESQQVSLRYLEPPGRPTVTTVQPRHTVALMVSEADQIAQDAYGRLEVEGPLKLTQVIPQAAVRRRVGSEVSDILASMPGVTRTSKTLGASTTVLFSRDDDDDRDDASDEPG
jgi:hypothetical protein